MLVAGLLIYIGCLLVVGPVLYCVLTVGKRADESAERIMASIQDRSASVCSQIDGVLDAIQCRWTDPMHSASDGCPSEWATEEENNRLRERVRLLRSVILDTDREAGDLRREIEATGPVVEMNDRRRRLLQEVKALLLSPGWGPVIDASIASRVHGILCRIDKSDPPFVAAGPGKVDASKTLGARAAALRGGREIA